VAREKSEKPTSAPMYWNQDRNPRVKLMKDVHNSERVRQHRRRGGNGGRGKDAKLQKKGDLRLMTYLERP